jgi:hypothetical protein
VTAASAPAPASLFGERVRRGSDSPTHAPGAGCPGRTGRGGTQQLRKAWLSLRTGARAQDGDVLLVATTRENVSPSLVLELLRRVGGIIKARAAGGAARSCL